MIRDPDELAQLWTDARLHGASAAARMHGCGRSTVYDLVARVDSDPVLLALAKSKLGDLRRAGTDRCLEVLHTALDGLDASMRDQSLSVDEGLKVVTRLMRLTGLAPSAPAEDDAGGRGSGQRAPRPGLIVPAVLVAERTEAGDRPALPAPAPSSQPAHPDASQRDAAPTGDAGGKDTP